MDKVQFPKVVREVIIAADADPTGIIAARKAAAAYSSRGVRVRVAVPFGGRTSTRWCCDAGRRFN